MNDAVNIAAEKDALRSRARAVRAALPAAIRDITSLARLAVETFERRSEVVTGSR